MKNKFAWIITGVTLLFCGLIAFDISPLLRGPAPYPPDWQWDYLFINTVSRIWAPVLIMGGLLYLVYRLELLSEKQIGKHEVKILMVLTFLSLCLQVSVTYFSRAGIGVLIQRIINPDMNGYFTAALTVQHIGNFLHEYNSLVLSFPMHAQGHPPGAILFFWVLLEITKVFSANVSFLQMIEPSHSDVAIIWKSLLLYEKAAALSSIGVICLLSSMAGVLIYYIGKGVFGIRAALRSVFFYLVTPSLLFFIPINDIFLPLFSLGSFLLFVLAIKQGNKWYMFFSGIIFSLGIFFSLSLLPLLLIFFIYALFQKKQFPFLVIFGLLFMGGFGILPILLQIFFGYNTIVVSQTLMSGLPEKRAYLVWIFYNLYDFFIFAGIPVFMLFLYHAKQSIQALFGRKPITHGALTIGFIGMLVILDISGSVRGEVARIWIPFYSFLVLCIGYGVTKELVITKRILVILLLLQCIQILVMQESWVMLW